MASQKPTAIIDIGSNSVRLVVYSGLGRVPSPTFNEKVLAGLGTGLAETGRLAQRSRDKALAALRRFRLLLDHMEVDRVRVVATAAVRDAIDGPGFVREIERIGFQCKVLSADDEARLAGEGVLSAIPHADGIVGDLGGGSLELVEVAGGQVGRRISMPLGVLRLERSKSGEAAALKILRKGLQDSGLAGRGRGRQFYMVGGSWRSLAKMDMAATSYPLPVTHQYSFNAERARALQMLADAPERNWTKRIAGARLASVPVAAMLLSLLVEEVDPQQLVVSTFGIREGLLFSSLRPKERTLDPLIEGARDAGGSERRFGEHGDLLDAWISPVFVDAPPLARLRRAACLLADVAWQASPEFRADRAVEMALHGGWVGVTAADRVVIAQALSASFGRDRLPGADLGQLCPECDLQRARLWGLAIRLAQRLSGGVGSVLESTSLDIVRGQLVLSVAPGETALVGEAVGKRLTALSTGLGVGPHITG